MTHDVAALTPAALELRLGGQWGLPRRWLKEEGGMCRAGPPAPAVRRVRDHDGAPSIDICLESPSAPGWSLIVSRARARTVDIMCTVSRSVTGNAADCMRSPQLPAQRRGRAAVHHGHGPGQQSAATGPPAPWCTVCCMQ